MMLDIESQGESDSDNGTRNSAEEVTAADVEDDGVLREGEAFKSFEEFEKRLEKFQNASFCAYYRRDSVTIERARRRGVTQKHIAKELRYNSVFYCCIQGGKPRKTTSTGQRNPSTMQKECAASFRLNVNKDGDALVVCDVKMDHNHECSKKLYQHLPQSRRLKPEDKEKVANLLRLGANRKKVKRQIEAETNKVVLLKDLSNLAARGADKNNLAATVKLLEEKYGAECHIYEEDNMFKGLFFVTDAMKSAMEAFPEFVGIDATFKLLSIRAPLYLTIVEDSEGCTKIVSGCILLSEDKESMSWFMGCFKAAHPSWNKIKCVMADKDLSERDIIKANFPSANVLICIFHSLRTFNREITCEKLGITPGQRDTAKEIIQKMVYAETEDRYIRLYDELKQLPPSVLTYFNNNWHGIRDEWTLNNNYMRNNFLNTTNNRVESLNAKIKSVVKRYSSLEDFVENFFLLVSCLQTERDHKAAYAYQKTRVVRFEVNSPEHIYSRMLTAYGFKFVKRELAARLAVKIEGDPSADDFYKLRTNDNTFRSSPTDCNCTAYTSMKLPCRHIFAVRDHLQMELANEALCAERWTRSYYYKKQRIFNTDEPEESHNQPRTITSAVKTRRILSQHEKYRKAAVITQDIAGLASEATGALYVQRMKILAEIKKAWQENCEVSVTRLDVGEPVALPSLQSSRESSGRMNDNRSDISIPVEEYPCEPSTSTAENVLGVIQYQANSNKNSLSRPISNQSDSDSDSVNEQPVSKSPPHTASDLAKIRVPPALKQRGRPKGAEKTMIGLPKRVVGVKTTAQPFCKKRESEKVLIMLQWFVDKDDAEGVTLRGEIIQESQVETRPDRISHAILDDDVNISLIKRFFSKDAWQVVKNVFKIKKQSDRWDCGICKIDLDMTVADENSSQNDSTIQKIAKTSIRCDYCLVWYHLPCIPLKKAPKTKFWMCLDCQKNKNV